MNTMRQHNTSTGLMFRRMRPLLGTFVEIALAAPAARAEGAVAAAFAAIEQVQQQMSFHDADSDLSRINLYA